MTLAATAPPQVVAARPVALARELALLGARVVVVGGTARALLGAPQRPADLDVAIDADDAAALATALGLLGSAVSARALARGGGVPVATAWGPLDVFVGPPTATTAVLVGGVALEVAA